MKIITVKSQVTGRTKDGTLGWNTFPPPFIPRVVIFPSPTLGPFTHS